MLRQLLEQAGYEIRGNFADCKNCDGNRRWTLHLLPGDEVAYCHRCKFKIGAGQLRKQLGLPTKLTPEERAAIKAREKEKEFRSWCWKQYDVAAAEFRELHDKMILARRILKIFPTEDLAWNALAAFYHAESRLSRLLDAYSFQKGSPWVNRTAARNSLLRKWEKDERKAEAS